MAVLRRDASHPCIVAWVPFNESWGVPNLPMNADERHYVRSLYSLTKTLDPSRPVVGNDGWESVATDIIGIHDYDADPEAIARRYRADEILPRLFKRERPGGRLLVLEGERHHEQPIVLSEFGGIAFAADARNTWGYSRASSPEELAVRYAALLKAVAAVGVLSGFCYTQFADTYQEANGLLFADRTPKIPLSVIASATLTTGERGPALRPFMDGEVIESLATALSPGRQCVLAPAWFRVRAPISFDEERPQFWRRASGPAPRPGPCCSTCRSQACRESAPSG